MISQIVIPLFSAMKRRFAFMGLILFLVAFSPLGEVLQIPLLFVHFSEHKQQDPSISFGHFLEMHYQANGDADGDYQKDLQLPFKSLEHSALLKLVFLPVPVIHTPAGNVPVLHKKQARYSEPFSVGNPGSVFHPPRA